MAAQQKIIPFSILTPLTEINSKLTFPDHF